MSHLHEFANCLNKPLSKRDWILAPVVLCILAMTLALFMSVTPALAVDPPAFGTGAFELDGNAIKELGSNGSIKGGL